MNINKNAIGKLLKHLAYILAQSGFIATGILFILASGDWLFTGAVRDIYMELMFSAGWMTIVCWLAHCGLIDAILNDPKPVGKREKAQ